MKKRKENSSRSTYRGNYLKKLAILSLSASLVSPVLLEPLNAVAVSTGDLQIKVHESPQIDIALTLGSTKITSLTLEDDLVKELEKRGINPDKVKFQSFNSTTVSTNDAGADEIFNNWENYPNNVGKWQLTTIDGVPVVRSTVNTQWTGFWKEDNAAHTEIKSQLAVTTTGDDDWVGITFRMNRYEPGHPENPYSGDVDAYDMYVFGMVGSSKYDSALFKITKAPFKNNLTGTHEMWNANQNKQGVGESKLSSYFKQIEGQLPKEYTAQTIPDDSEIKGKIIPLQLAKTNNLNWKINKFQDIEIKAIGNYIQIWVDGKKEIDFYDEDNPILSGGYGPYAASQSHATHRNMSITKKERRSFLEILMSPQWRDNSEKFIINLDDDLNPSFEDPQESGEINMRLINDSIDYVAVGSDNNKVQSEKVVNQVNGEGTFINSDSNYETVIKEVADYIESQIKRKSADGTQYVIVGEDLEMEVTPESYKSNTENTKYPNGRWRLDHDENYFHNSLGRHANSGLYQSDLDFRFELPGKYELWFENVHPNPRYIYAHRRPVANFSLNVKDKGTDYQVNIEDFSYDLDLEYQTDNGIAEKEWKWRKTTSDKWNIGKVPSTLPKGDTYIIQLRVKDHQGVWSEPESRYITTDSVETKPIASFEMPRTAFIDDDVKTTNTSYDPSGKEIMEEEWTYLKKGEEVYKGNVPIVDFKKYGIGEYKVQLKVKSQSGLWSDQFERTIEIRPELVGEITITPTPSGWTNGNVRLDIETKNISKLLMPDGTFVTNSNTAITVTENGNHTFIGYNAKGEVITIATYVVDNIDREGKEPVVVPGDGKWRNKDIEVQINVSN